MTEQKLRCALVSSFTLDALPQLVTERLRAGGVTPEWHVTPFNQYQQAILDASSALYRFDPQVVFLAVDAEDVFGGLPALATPDSARAEPWGATIATFVDLIRHLAERLSSAAIFVHSFVRLRAQPNVLLSYKGEASPGVLVDRANLALAEVAGDIPKVFILDLAAALGQVSLRDAFDARYFYLAKMRFGQSALSAVGDLYSRAILAHCGKRKKCIVLDLDNTLWGGVVGEDGAENLTLSDDGPGRAYQDFQRTLLAYLAAGTILAICSKNDERLAMETLREHPAMILRPEHFSALRINWQDKAANLQELAKELNLGLDSFVLLDDSPHERELIRAALPQVTVPDFPDDPSDLPAFASALPLFDTLAITAADRQRSELYRAEALRTKIRSEAESLDDFFRSLAVRATVAPADRFSLPRIAQLTQRTNQFNLTTRRYTAADVESRLATGNWLAYTISVSDRIGDSGIVGAALVEIDRGAVSGRLDVFLLSCRVLGRGVENAFLAGVAQDLQVNGVRRLMGEFVSTSRNAVSASFLSDRGFVEENGQLTRDVQELVAACPEWIQLHVSEAQS